MPRLRLLTVFAAILSVGCQPTYSVVKPDFGDSEYANFNERLCRADITDICVETDVAIDEATIRILVATAKPHHVKIGDVIAVRISEHLSDLNKLPTIEIVSGSYGWTDDGDSWDGHEEVSIFVWRGSEWRYKETVELIIDPV